jgi:hypothetical protein
LKELDTGIEKHREVTGNLPARLADLEIEQGGIPVDASGQPVDGWGRALQYRVTGESYELFSYGRDGQPGGTGLDADLYSGAAPTVAELPTLWQFTANPSTKGIRLSCILAGLIAFPLCLLQARDRPDKPRSLSQILVAHAVTAVFAIGTAVVISILHIPSGH